MSDCSIILLSYNGGSLTREALAAVLAQQTERTFQVIVIDSGSSDGSVEYLRQQPVQLVQISNSEFGHGATRNQGARMADSPLLVFLSQDAVPATMDWLDNLLAPLANPGVGAVYGRQLPRDTHICERFFLEQTYPPVPRRRTLNPGKPLTLRDIFLSNVHSACRTEVWEQCPFDEGLVMCEDQQWAKDILSHGYEIVYEPKAAVYHSHRYTPLQAFKRNFDTGASLRHVTQGRIGTSPGEFLSYVVKECRLAAREASILHVPYVLLYEASRLAGFAVGTLEPWLPTRLKVRLSQHRRHWQKEAQRARKAGAGIPP